MGIVDRSIGRLPSHPHPSPLKEIPKILPQVSGVPVLLPTFRAVHSPPGLYHDRKGGEAHDPLHQYLDNWLIRSLSREEALVNTQAVVDLTQPLGWIINQQKSELNPTQVFFVRGLRIPPGFSPCKTHSREMAQTRILSYTSSQNMFLTARCLMSLMRPLQFHIKEHWKFPQPLDSLLPWTEAISAHLDWWQNPANVMKGSDLHPKGHSIQLFQTPQTKWSPQEKGLHINVLELKAFFLALRHFKDQCQDQTVLVATDNSTVIAYINKQGGTHSAEMCALLWRIMTLSHNIESQAHSRVPECDGRPAVQVESGPVNGMVTTSTGVQTDMPTVVHSPRGPVYHSSEPQASAVRVSYPRPQGLGHRCSKYKLDGSHCLSFPSNGSPSQGDPKIWQCHCLIIVIAPGWPGMPWFWDLVQLPTEIQQLLKQSHNYVFHSNPQHLNLHAWCLGVDNSKNKTFL